MDIQIKKGLLDVCVLATLRSGESYGYKIISDVSHCVEISESTLYPILKRLEQTGSLTTYTAVHNGRLRKYYKICKAGLRRIDEFLEEFKQIMAIYKYVAGESV